VLLHGRLLHLLPTLCSLEKLQRFITVDYKYIEKVVKKMRQLKKEMQALTFTFKHCPCNFFKLLLDAGGITPKNSHIHLFLLTL